MAHMMARWVNSSYLILTSLTFDIGNGGDLFLHVSVCHLTGDYSGALCFNLLDL